MSKSKVKLKDKIKFKFLSNLGKFKKNQKVEVSSDDYLIIKRYLFLEENKEGLVEILDPKADVPFIDSIKVEAALEGVKSKYIDKRFYSPKLLEEIWKELDKTHKVDDKEKLAVFIIAISAELKDPADRCSAALKGDSSEGKDSIIKTVLQHLPKEDNYFLTRATVSSIEDNLHSIKRVAFSEMNKHRDKGANAELTEVFKQITEGGVEVIKKDVTTGFRTTKHIKVPQKTALYGTTETQSDDELETRYVIIPVKGYPQKNKVVVNDFSDKVANFDYVVNSTSEKDSWICSSIRGLSKNIFVSIPFAPLLKEKIKDGEKEKYFFDFTKGRIKRDVKRLYGLTKAIAWLHQKQRNIIEYGSHRILIAEPSDFITAVTIFADFFNLTYSGLDYRNQKCLETIRELEGKHDGEISKLGFDMSKYSGYVIRHILQDKLGISSQITMRKRIETLKDHGYIADVHWNKETNSKACLIKSEGVNAGVNRVSLGVSITTTNNHLTTYLTPQNIQNMYNNKEIVPISLDFLQIGYMPKKNNTLKNNSVKNAGYTDTKKRLNCLYSNREVIDQNELVKELGAKLVGKYLTNGTLTHRNGGLALNVYS